MPYSLTAPWDPLHAPLDPLWPPGPPNQPQMTPKQVSCSHSTFRSSRLPHKSHSPSTPSPMSPRHPCRSRHRLHLETLRPWDLEALRPWDLGTLRPWDLETLRPDQTRQDQTAVKDVSLQGKLLQVYLSTVFAPKSRVDLADLSSPVWSCFCLCLP